MAKYPIEKNVPIPPRLRRRGREPLYSWREMVVGDSFFVPAKTPHSLSTQISRASRDYGKKFTSRPENGGTRVWRIE